MRLLLSPSASAIVELQHYEIDRGYAQYGHLPSPSASSRGGAVCLLQTNCLNFNAIYYLQKTVNVVCKDHRHTHSYR